jgi:ectoine hydroxylase-related dioxygenase (phytanoyl-CoA dioxygenase family)
MIGPEIESDQVEQYHQNGYLVLRGRFDDAEVRQWSEAAERIWQLPGLVGEESFRVQGRDKLSGGRVLERVDWVLRESAIFSALAEDERITTPVSQLFGTSPVLFKDKLVVRPPGTHGYGLHQDYPYWEEAGIPAAHLLSVCIAIDSVDATNGPLTLYRGYHEQRLGAPAGESRDTCESEVASEHAEVIELAAGDLLYFHTLTPHRSSPNRSDRSRRTLYLSYAASRYGPNLYERYYSLKSSQTPGPPAHGRAPGRKPIRRC